MTSLALKAHQTLCKLNLHLWGRARRVTGIAGQSRTCQSCGQKQRFPVQTKADASHAAKVATSGLRTVRPQVKMPSGGVYDLNMGPPSHLPLTPEGEAAEMRQLTDEELAQAGRAVKTGVTFLNPR